MNAAAYRATGVASIARKPINSEQSALTRGRSLTHAPQRDVRGKNPTGFVQLGCYQPCVPKGAVRGVILGRPFPVVGAAVALNGVPVFSRLQAAMDERRTDQLVFFAFDPVPERPEHRAPAAGLLQAQPRDDGVRVSARNQEREELLRHWKDQFAGNSSLRVTPAVADGLSKNLWSMDGVVKMVEDWEESQQTAA